MSRFVGSKVWQLVPVACLVVAFAGSGDVFGLSLVVNDPGWSTDYDECTDPPGKDAKCTLNAAIIQGNRSPGPHTITFAVPAVTLTNDLQQLRARFTITGTLPQRTVLNGNRHVNGIGYGCFSLTDSGETGVVGNELGADGSTIANMVIQGCRGDGISANGHGYTFINNYIGTDVTGTQAVENDGDGISISASREYDNDIYVALDNLLGDLPGQPLDQEAISSIASQIGTLLANGLLGPVTITGNVLSGNEESGLEVLSENRAGVVVSGNMIGTDPTGTLAVPNGEHGIHFTAPAFANVIGPGNVISGNMENGIEMSARAVFLPNFIFANRIGLSDISGAAVGNGRSGIRVNTWPSTGKTTGRENVTEIALIIGPANVISGNKGSNPNPDGVGDDSAGILITGESSGIRVIGNTIGLAESALGTPHSLPDYGNAGDGIIITVPNITIGGSDESDANVIAANARHGILVKGPNTTGTKILGNFIGVHPDLPDDFSLGNGFDGIQLRGEGVSMIGGEGANDFNTIAANGRNGVKLVEGWGHLLQRNLIYGNGTGNVTDGMGIAIDLEGPDDAENNQQGNVRELECFSRLSYTNLDQVQPVICTGLAGEPDVCNDFIPTDTGDATDVSWTLRTHGPGSVPTSYRLEFFSIDKPSLNAATKMTFLGEEIVTTDLGGVLRDPPCQGGLCVTKVPVSMTAGRYVAMTATDITMIENEPGEGWLSCVECIVGDDCLVNNTSEFSNVAPVAADTMIVASVSPTTIVVGESVTVSAEVTAVAGVPTGNVTIILGTNSCTEQLSPAGGTTSTASCKLDPVLEPSENPYEVTASYEGVAMEFNGSSGSAFLTVIDTPTETPTEPEEITNTPTETPTKTPTPSETLTPTDTPTPGDTLTPTPTPTITDSPSPTETPTQTDDTPTPTFTPSDTPTPTPTEEDGASTHTPTATTTASPTHSATPTPTPDDIATSTATAGTGPSSTPTPTPTETETPDPMASVTATVQFTPTATPDPNGTLPAPTKALGDFDDACQITASADRKAAWPLLVPVLLLTIRRRARRTQGFL